MRTSVKVALAGTLGGALLLGGAGTLAYWTDSKDVPAASLASGSLRLTVKSCPDWTLDGSAGLLAERQIVPGDTVTRSCTYDLVVTGSHLTAELDVAVPGAATDVKDLLGELVLERDFSIAGGSFGSATTVDAGTPLPLTAGAYVVTARYEAAFPFDSSTGGTPTPDNDSQADTATIPAVSMTVTQTDSHPTD